MRRRRFLAIVGGALAAAVAACRGGSSSPDLVARVRTFLTDPDGAADLGAWADVADPAAVLPPADLDDGAFAVAVRETVAADWAAGRVEVVDGWHLSRTEAALCAVLNPRQ